jgi:hypothetical protein
MTPQANTLFSVCLFLALCALNSWTIRRGRHQVRRQSAESPRTSVLRVHEAV